MITEKLYSHYVDRYEKYGYSYKTLGWGSVESQMLRFQILADIGDLSGTTVCDIGCGFGDLYPYLISRFGKIDYLGIDICPTLIEEAQKQFPLARFEVRDILENPSQEKFDYILSSGVLNFKTGPGHIEYIHRMLDRMYSMCEKGLAINFLTKYVDYELEKDFHFSPEAAFSMAMKHSRWVTLKHNYPLYEFTLFIYRDSVPQKK